VWPIEVGVVDSKAQKSIRLPDDRGLKHTRASWLADRSTPRFVTSPKATERTGDGAASPFTDGWRELALLILLQLTTWIRIANLQVMEDVRLDDELSSYRLYFVSPSSLVHLFNQELPELDRPYLWAYGVFFIFGKIVMLWLVKVKVVHHGNFFLASPLVRRLDGSLQHFLARQLESLGL
jgi:hypothetical protein